MTGPTRSNRSDRALLGVLLGFTLVSVLGYWNFALHPERLPRDPFAIRFYTISFHFFARLHIALAAAVLGVWLVRHAGWRWTPALAAIYALSFTAEHLGTGYGIPFGGYGYTGLLGARLGSRVPLLIPLSWFLMALPSYVLARAAWPARLPVRLAFGALGLVVWDLALDPAMSHLTPYWSWEETGPYYGMPLVNLLGWFATGLVLMAALEVLERRGAGLAGLPTRWLARYYLVIALMPLGMLVAAGAWTAVLVSTVAVGSWLAGAHRRVPAAVSVVGADQPLRDPTPVGTL